MGFLRFAGGNQRVRALLASAECLMVRRTLVCGVRGRWGPGISESCAEISQWFLPKLFLMPVQFIPVEHHQTPKSMCFGFVQYAGSLTY